MTVNAFQHIAQIESNLWEAADQLRANSKLTSSEYCMPVLGVIFLRHATNRYEAAAKAIGSTVQQAPALTLSANSLPGGLNDPMAVGAIFGLDSAQATPVKGDIAVYLARLNSVTEAPPMADDPQALKALTDRVRNRADGQAFNALKEAADVTDNRSKFY